MQVFVILFCCATAAFAAPNSDELVELPNELTICYLDSPNRDECIKQSAQRFLPSLHQGIPSLDFPSIDPWIFNDIVFEFKNVIQGRVNVNSSKVYGISRAEIKDVRSKFTGDKMKLQIDVNIPRVYIEGTLKGEGRVGTFLINPNGHYNITANAIETTWDMTGKLIERNGNKYMKIVKFDLVPSIGNMKVFFDLLADKELNRLGLEFINQYWRMAVTALVPESKKFWEVPLVEQANRFFLAVPFDRIFPTLE